MNIDFDHVVKRPAGELFAVLGDPSRRQAWNASVRNVELLTPGPPGVGTRWREETWGLGAFTIEIVEFEPDRRFGEVTRDAGSDLRLSFELTPVGAGNTLVHVEAGGQMIGWRRLPQRLLEPVMPRLMRADLSRAASC